MVPADSACDRSGPAFAGRSRPESSRGRRRMRIELLSSGKTRWEWNEECNSAAVAPTPAQASQRATTSGPAGNELAAPAPAIDLRQDLLNRLSAADLEVRRALLGHGDPKGRRRRWRGVPRQAGQGEGVLSGTQAGILNVPLMA